MHLGKEGVRGWADKGGIIGCSHARAWDFCTKDEIRLCGVEASTQDRAEKERVEMVRWLKDGHSSGAVVAME